MSNSCYYSSWVFLSNAVVGLYQQEYMYGSAFASLLVTSIIFHSLSAKNIYITILDQVAIFSCVACGAYVLYSKLAGVTYAIEWLLVFCICMTFIGNIVLFYYGYLYKQFCYCDDHEMRNVWHSYLHLLGSIGHHLIMML
jgi:hypothetical protein